MAAGVLGYGERNNLGLMGMHGYYSANCAANRADVMIAIGTRFSDRVALNTSKFGHNAKIVHIDIDPSEINKNIIKIFRKKRFHLLMKSNNIFLQHGILKDDISDWLNKKK